MELREVVDRALAVASPGNHDYLRALGASVEPRRRRHGTHLTRPFNLDGDKNIGNKWWLLGGDGSV